MLVFDFSAINRVCALHLQHYLKSGKSKVGSRRIIEPYSNIGELDVLNSIDSFESKYNL